MTADFQVDRTTDGATTIRARRELGSYGRAVCDDLFVWARARPEATFVAARSTDGRLRELTYAAALARVRTLGGGLLASGASAERPIGVIAENGIDHALLTLAALYVGIPVSPVSVGYASAGAASGRLRDVLATLAPAFVFASDPTIADRAAPFARIVTSLDELAGDAERADDAARRIDPDGVAKIMFTSGSTGTPKGVVTTQRMLCANQAMLSAVWPELSAHVPVIVDWLPWSHCFGGSHNFGMILHNGGTLYVDAGRPVPAAFEQTVRNLREYLPTIFFSVPCGIALLVDRLKADADIATRVFSQLRIVCSGGASLPDPLRLDVFALARTYAERSVRVTSSWGSTECAPLATTSWGSPEPDRDTIGTPVPGVALKLAPLEDRYEIRVKGVNITPGYWRDRDATREAFDDEGFYRTGDAGRLKDPDDASRGIVFEGRVVENFKLTSGTWVNVGALRLALLERGTPLLEDILICGHDRDDIGIVAFLDRANDRTDDQVAETLAALIAQHNASAPGSSTRVARALIAREPPSRADGEITDKGSLNQRLALRRRAASVAELYAEPASPNVIVPARLLSPTHAP